MLYKSFEEFKKSSGYEIDGIWYPRVTSILSIKAKAALYIYYASMPSFRMAEAIKNRSAEEGTLVHNIVEAILKNEPIDIPEYIKPSIDVFKEFLQGHKVVPIKIEERIVSREHGYAGTIDILAEVDGVMGVLDIKTSQGIYRDYGMQTAAYIQALREADSSIPPLTSWVLRLDQAAKCISCKATLRKKGGHFKIRGEKFPCNHQWSEPQGNFEFKEISGFDLNFKAFLAAKQLWEWENYDHLQRLSPTLI
jgi:hypothetical protein